MLASRLLAYGETSLQNERSAQLGAAAKERSAVVSRHLDTTPLFLRFGMLEEHVAQHARYFIPAEETISVGGVETRHVRWKLVTREEYRAHDSKKPCHSGVLEIYGQISSVSIARYADHLRWTETYQVSTETKPLAARVLENGTASTLHRAMEESGDRWDCHAIRQFAKNSGVIILNEVPDRGKACVRVKHARALHFAADPNVLYDEDGSCAVHEMHNGLTKMTKESDFVGHAHATYFVLNLEARRRSLLGGLRHLVSQDSFVSSEI